MPKKTVALIGNPNCGKTTLFNKLTGSNQRVGNWPGVTVEKKVGNYLWEDGFVEVVDLPGIYHLSIDEHAPIDEKIAAQYLNEHKPDIVINVIDVTQIERSLYLTTQLLEMELPVIVVLNMIDLAPACGLNINLTELANYLGCPVLAISAQKYRGIEQIKKEIWHYQASINARFIQDYPEKFKLVFQKVKAIKPLSVWAILQRLEGHIETGEEEKPYLEHFKEQYVCDDQPMDLMVAKTRYDFIDHVLLHCLKQTKQERKLTARLDKIFLHRVFGLPLFFLSMYALFFFAINIGGLFQDFFTLSSETLFVQGLAHGLQKIHAPYAITVILAAGIGKGISTTLAFVPVISCMFFFLAFLEASGYMMRAAFVIDRFMRSIGLPGKAFAPLIIGFGCNVPAVLATRSLDNPRDRILTAMMAPFMSCSARLAIFAVFASAFFPNNGQNIIFLLYCVGMLVGISTAFLLRKTLLKGKIEPLIMELPRYHWPHFKDLALQTWMRLRHFIYRAGKVIIPVCILLGVLNAVNVKQEIIFEGGSHSLLAIIGQWLTPVFKPMGIDVNNWPAVVGLLTGVLAKEVVIGTLNSLYMQLSHITTVVEHFSLWQGLWDAVLSIPQHFNELIQGLLHPFSFKMSEEMNQAVYGQMYLRFHGKAGAFAYMLFVLLYFPCVSTTAVMLKELSKAWTYFAMGWALVVAYTVSVIVYQILSYFF